MGLALWLVPARPQLPTIQAVQSELRRLHPSTPRFEPHVTLLAGFDPAVHGDAARIWEVTRAEVGKWRATRKRGEMKGALDVKLADVTTRNMFFQCILASLHKDADLMALNSALRTAFDLITSQPPYFPHLSLLYGDLTPTQIQDTIQTLLDRGIFERHAGDSEGVVLVGDGKEEDEVRVDALELVHVELWDCEGRPEEWKQVHSLTL
ncbi:hypothetical protein OC835_003535 [Tilletia horrida]|nr:hypothetical protein OC835_003535 [Tilletia horrida]KAK0551304.1 hypothetical protein OC844_006587 [Tilletia horrida]